MNKILTKTQLKLYLNKKDGPRVNYGCVFSKYPGQL